ARVQVERDRGVPAEIVDQRVGARAAVVDIVLRAAGEHGLRVGDGVVTVAGVDRVVARAGIDGVVAPARIDGVVATEAVDDVVARAVHGQYIGDAAAGDRGRTAHGQVLDVEQLIAVAGEGRKARVQVER